MFRPIATRRGGTERVLNGARLPPRQFSATPIDNVLTPHDMLEGLAITGPRVAV